MLVAGHVSIPKRKEPANAQQTVENMCPLLAAYGHGVYNLKRPNLVSMVSELTG